MQVRWAAGGRRFEILAVAALAALGTAATLPNLSQFSDATGTLAVYSAAGAIDTRSSFFQPLGTNGRSCATCHVPANALGLSSATAQQRFAATAGSDPLFADVDGANCPGAPASDPLQHSLMLEHGLVRVALPLPPTADYLVDTVYDPYGCADTTDPGTGQRILSVYRRPLPGANLHFLSAVMWDGRETVAPLDDPATFQANLVTDLTHQALDATLGHAQAAHQPSSRQLADIVNFEMSLYASQATDTAAGSLRAQGASGGPVALSIEPYYPGINDSLGGDPGGSFTNQVFTLFAPWTDLSGSRQVRSTAAREQIAAGEAIFNTFPLTITDVGGLNDTAGTSVTGTCSTCHDAPNSGGHSLPLPLDVGVSHVSGIETDPGLASALTQLSSPALPIYKITCTATSPVRTVFTTDPGRALITGKCSDLNRLKGPVLRGLAARAPYFHNGSASTLLEVVNFYDARFGMGLTDEQKQQLVSFLRSL